MTNSNLVSNLIAAVKHLISDASSNGLLRKPTAPLSSARVRFFCDRQRRSEIGIYLFRGARSARCGEAVYPRFSPLTDGLGAYLPAIAPNHFVYGLSARVAQNEFAGHFKTVRITDSHAAIKLVHNEAVVRRRVRLGHNDPNVPKGPPHRATRLPDHGVTYRLVKNPHAPSVKLPTRKLRPT